AGAVEVLAVPVRDLERMTVAEVLVAVSTGAEALDAVTADRAAAAAAAAADLLARERDHAELARKHAILAVALARRVGEALTTFRPGRRKKGTPPPAFNRSERLAYRQLAAMPADAFQRYCEEAPWPSRRGALREARRLRRAADAPTPP